MNFLLYSTWSIHAFSSRPWPLTQYLYILCWVPWVLSFSSKIWVFITLYAGLCHIYYWFKYPGSSTTQDRRHNQSSTWLGFDPETSRSWQYISCPWGAYPSYSARDIISCTLWHPANIVQLYSFKVCFPFSMTLTPWPTCREEHDHFHSLQLSHIIFITDTTCNWYSNYSH